MSGREADPLFDMVPVELGRSRSTVVAGGADDDGFGHVHPCRHDLARAAELPVGSTLLIASHVPAGWERIPAGYIELDGRRIDPDRLRPGPIVRRTAAFDAEAFRALTFASEDNLSRFVAALSDEEGAALYALLYGRGIRYAPDALAKWRRTR